jgi:hypothetical protein
MILWEPGGARKRLDLTVEHISQSSETDLEKVMETPVEVGWCGALTSLIAELSTGFVTHEAQTLFIVCFQTHRVPHVCSRYLVAIGGIPLVDTVS